MDVKTDTLRFPFYFYRYKQKGLNIEGTKIADDLCYGDGITITDHFRYSIEEIRNISSKIEKQINASDSELWSALTNHVKRFSIGGLQKAGMDMLKHFEFCKGGEYSNHILTGKITRHSNTKLFCGNIESDLRNKLQQSKGDISFLTDKNVYKSDNYFRPVFPGLNAGFLIKLIDRLSGLTILIHDFWAYEILITKFSIINKSDYELTYKVILFDHFGLNKSDVDKFPFFAGFRTWFVLQHLRNYKPFITKVEFENSITGNICAKGINSNNG